MEKCSFHLESFSPCEEPRTHDSQFCFFHDPSLPKNTPEARQCVIDAVQAKKRLNGARLKGIDLSRAALQGAWLIRADLEGASLERANLEGAHLYNANFRGANLFNANLRFSNIKETDMTGADLLEVKLEDAKIFGINWGAANIVKNEVEAKRLDQIGRRQEAKLKYREAEETYLNIRSRLLVAGDFRRAGDFFYRVMVMNRKQKPFFSFTRFGSKVIDLLCGYGEKTFRIFSSAALFIFFCSAVYFLTGVRHGDELLQFSLAQGFAENMHDYLLTLYYSVITYTTTGYGDIIPFGVSRFFAALEAFLGSFIMALFVIVFGRKMLQ